MDAVPSFFALLLGVILGCIAIGRIARWVQLLLATMGRDPARPAIVVGAFQKAPFLLATIVHPIPWLLLGGIGFAAYFMFIGQTIAIGWKWFFCGFFLGPLLLLAWIYLMVARNRNKRVRKSAPPPS